MLFLQQGHNELEAHLKGLGIELRHYDGFATQLRQMALGKTVVEKGSCTLLLLDAVQDPLLVDVSPVETFKARKNAAEIEGMRQAGLKDSAAICRYLAWLEATVKREKARRAKV